MTKLKKRIFSLIDETVYQGTLENGMTVYCVPKPDFKEFSMMVSVKVGALDTEVIAGDEKKAYPSGVAHFLEHKLFEMTDSQDASIQLSADGADSNAFTGLTQTSYYFSTTQNIRQNMVTLLEMLSSLEVTADSIAREKEIIQQEIDMYLDTPDSQLYQGLLKNLFPDTPIAEDIAGDSESLAKIDETVLRENYNLFYTPDNMTVVLAGDIKQADMAYLVSELNAKFSSRQSKITRQPLQQTPVLASQTITGLDMARPKFGIGYRRFYSVPREDYLTYKLALQIYVSLMLGWTSDNYQSMYNVGLIDESFAIEVEVDTDFQYIVVTTDTSKPIELSMTIRKMVERFIDDATVSEEEFQNAVYELYGEFMIGLDRIDDIVYQVSDYGRRGLDYFQIPDVLRELRLEKVLAIGQSFFKDSESSELILTPKLS